MKGRPRAAFFRWEKWLRGPDRRPGSGQSLLTAGVRFALMASPGHPLRFPGFAFSFLLRPDARLRSAPTGSGCSGHAERGLHRLHAFSVRRRSGDEHPGAGRDAGPARAAPVGSRTGQAVSGAVRPLRRACGAGRIRAQPATGAKGLLPDCGAAACHARALLHRRHHRARRGHPHGGLFGAPAGDLLVTDHDDALVDRCLVADLPDRHPADPLLRRDPQVAAQFRTRRSRFTRRMDDWLSHVDGWKHLVLPAITLAIFQLALIMRLVRSEMLEVLRADTSSSRAPAGFPTGWSISVMP